MSDARQLQIERFQRLGDHLKLRRSTISQLAYQQMGTYLNREEARVVHVLALLVLAARVENLVLFLI